MPRNYQAKRTQRASGNFTPEKRRAFLDALRTGISMAGAARVAGMSHSFIYDLKAKDAKFCTEINEAREAGSDRMEDALLSLGVKDKSVTALIFLLNGRRPEIYRQNMLVQGNLMLTSADQLEQARERAAKRDELPPPEARH